METTDWTFRGESLHQAGLFVLEAGREQMLVPKSALPEGIEDGDSVTVTIEVDE